MTFITLTDGNGKPVTVQAEHITLMKQADVHPTLDGCTSISLTGGEYVVVQESQEQICARAQRSR